jgi:catechol 2,3-dioxygenase-like lactoylglutathione lyase family enzyme
MVLRPEVSKLDHYAIDVRNLEETHRFYHDILGFEQIERPNFDFPGAWYRVGHVSMHVILNAARSHDIHSESRALHFAFTCSNIMEMKEYLISCGVEIVKDIKPRPDGVLQMFVRDPDGYFIEFTMD